MTGLVVDALGPTERAWAVRVESLPRWTVPRAAHAIVVGAHPDDETFGVGGTLQLLAQGGGHIELLAVTDGEGSHPGFPDLAGRRRAELRAALQELGIAEVTTVHHLGLPDGAVRDHEARLVRAILALGTASSLLLGPHPDDGHTDHDAAGRATLAAARRAGMTSRSYPVWAWHWHEPATSSLLTHAWRVPLPSAVLDRKRRAVACYRSQVTAELGAPVVPPHVLTRLLRPAEVLVDPCG